MIKELKFVFFILIIILFLIFTGRFYFSDENKKNLFRSINNINSKINSFSENLIVLKNNTNYIIEYTENEFSIEMLQSLRAPKILDSFLKANLKSWCE